MALFLDVIEFLDNEGNEIVHRVPQKGSADTSLGSQLVVRESQSAVFFRDGRALDNFGPGRHTLTTANLPLLKKVVGLAFGGKSPFRVEVYFVNHKVFTNAKWGTQEPIPFRDRELKMIRIRANGIYSYKVTQPQIFVNKIVGTENIKDRNEVEEFFKNVIVSRLTDFLGETYSTIFDLPRDYDELSIGAKSRIFEDFDKYGLELTDFYIRSITPPQEVQKMIDERTGMGVVGDLDKFTQFQAAKALRDAASQEGGAAGTGVGVGAGIGMGAMIPGMLKKSTQQPEQVKTCPKCGEAVPDDAKFCPHCGVKFEEKRFCPECGKEIQEDAKFCPHCGRKL
ncbi:MAG: SPFH domain-containing protein [candidate division WOR-3 bacterium]|nr:SPFH domain-containing protein [candidate division WOR-3 bacterium]